MRTIRLLCLAALASAPGWLPAQRPIDLSGTPSAALGEPLTDVTHGIELGDGRFLFIDRREKALRLADLGSGRVVTLGQQGAGPNRISLSLRSNRRWQGRRGGRRPLAPTAAPGHA